MSASVLLAGASFLGLTGCETTGDLTVDLPDTQPTSSTYLDIPVSTATVLLDPALTLKADRFLVGRLRDQVTGQTEARAVLNLQVRLPLDSLPGRLSYARPTSVQLESVALVAPIEQVYGTATAPLRFDVLPLSQRLDDRVVYDATSAGPAVGATPVATGLSAPLNAPRQVTQTASDGSGTPITTTTTDLLTRQELPSGTSSVLGTIFQKLNSTSFTQTDLDGLLPGVVLAPSAGYEGSIVGFGRGRANGHIRFSFAYDSITQASPLLTVRKRRSYRLFFGPSLGGTGAGTPQDPRYFTQLKNDRSGSALASLSSSSSAVPAAALDGRSYLQAGTGLGTRITFGSLTQLEALRKTGIAINRAELLVPVQPFTTGLFPYPPSFYAFEVDASNKVLVRTLNGVPVERIVQRDGASQQGSGVNAVASLVNASATNPYYSLLVTSYLQAYLTTNGLGTDQPLPDALVLTPTLRSGMTVAVSSTESVVSLPLTLNRAVLDANNIHLRVYYSQLR